MKVIPMEERRQILLELEVEDSKVVREKHDINNTVLSHIRFFHGNSTAKNRGYYHKDLLQGAESPYIAQIRVLKKQGKKSDAVARELGWPLEKVNAVWGRISTQGSTPKD